MVVNNFCFSYSDVTTSSLAQLLLEASSLSWAALMGTRSDSSNDTDNSGTSGDSVNGSEGPATDEPALLSIKCDECNLFLLDSRNRCIVASSFLLRDHGLLFDLSMAYSSYVQVINGLKRLSVHKNSVHKKTTTRTRS